MRKEADLIGEYQYSYAWNSSTTVTLIKAVDSWNSKLAIDRGEKVVNAFLDLRNSFDIIDHNNLLNKMRNNGVTGTELNWFFLPGKSPSPRLKKPLSRPKC